MGLFGNEAIKKTPAKEKFETKLHMVLIELEKLFTETSKKYIGKKVTCAELMNIFSQRCRELGFHTDLITYFGTQVTAETVQQFIDFTIKIYVQAVKTNISVKSD